MLFEIVKEFDLECHSVRHTGLMVRIIDNRTEQPVFTHFVNVNPIALKVQEGFLCAGNMKLDERPFRLRLDMVGRDSVRFEQHGTDLRLVAQKRYLLFTRTYRFRLETCPVKCIIVEQTLFILCPSACAPVLRSPVAALRSMVQRRAR